MDNIKENKLGNLASIKDTKIVCIKLDEVKRGITIFFDKVFANSLWGPPGNTFKISYEDLHKLIVEQLKR